MEEAERGPSGFEYLDHTADVQLHGWGQTLEEALSQTAIAMFGYMTTLETIEESDIIQISAEGHDMLSLVYNFLDTLLYNFCAEQYFVARRVQVFALDRNSYKLRAQCYGETFDLKKHPQGTEVKAITYSNMQVHDCEDRHEVFVIVDI